MPTNPSFRSQWLLAVAVPLIAFAALIAALHFLNRAPASPTTASAGASGLASGPAPQTTEALVRDLQEAVAAEPGDAQLYAELGDAYYQRARETGDPAYYTRSEDAIDTALELDPGNPEATVGAGTLALARHDFAAALRWGHRAVRTAPYEADTYGLLGDAQVELGRYDDAARSLDRMVGLKPNLASYSRISYYRELHGDLDGALEAMRLAVSAGGGAPENVAYVQTLLGNLDFQRGEIGAARLEHWHRLRRELAYLVRKQDELAAAEAKGRVRSLTRAARARVREKYGDS